MGLIYLALLAGAITASFMSKDIFLRLASIVMASGSLATMLIFALVGRNWNMVATPVLLVDLAMLGAFAAVARASDMRWALVVCAMQLLGVGSHFAGSIAHVPFANILGVAQGLWSYVQCLAIIFASMMLRRAITDHQKMTSAN